MVRPRERSWKTARLPRKQKWKSRELGSGAHARMAGSFCPLKSTNCAQQTNNYSTRGVRREVCEMFRGLQKTFYQAAIHRNGCAVDIGRALGCKERYQRR